jgi:serine/threonine protein kinase
VSAYHKNALPSGFQLSEYTIESVLGHGGFGITYLAHDTTLDAKVAIKEYLPHQIAQRESKNAHVLPHPSRDAVRDYHWGLKNFVKEARALAQFKHPHIVRVLRFFEANGTAYMVMEYEHGQSLAQYLKQEGPRLEEATLLRIFIPILNGLHAVHEAKMLHLDIKPENIYIRADGSAILIDFGSARQAIAAQSHGQRIALTHGYAPMEQYPDKGQPGPWTDIYAIGAAMYRCVSGKKPDDALERYQSVLKYKADPLTPATKVGKGRYQQVLLECIDWAMEIYPKDRPQSARELQDALMGKGRGLRKASSPATFGPAARPAPGGATRPAPVRYTSRTDSRPHTTSGALIAALLAALALAGYVYWSARQEAGPPPAATPEAAPRPPETSGVSPATQVPAATEPRAGAPVVSTAAGSTPPAVAGPVLSGHGDWVTSVAFSSDSHWLASGSNDKTVRVWDAASGALIGTLRGHNVAINAVAISRDSRWIASAGNDGTVRLWDVKTGEQRATLRGYGYALFAIAVSPDSQRVAAAGRDRAVFVWQIEGGKRLYALEGHKGDVNALAFSPDGRQIASAGADHMIRIWSAHNGTEVAGFSGHKESVLALAYSPDGRWLASGDAGNSIRLWNGGDYTHVRTITEVGHAVLGLAFSPDGRWLAAGSADRTLRIFDVNDGRLVQSLDGHQDYVNAVAFSDDGTLLASGGRDRSVRLWKPRK